VMCGGEAWRIVEPNNNRKDHHSKNHYHQNPSLRGRCRCPNPR
jgi:hypothetical protein